MAQLMLFLAPVLAATSAAAGLGVPLKRGWNLGNTLDVTDPWHCTHPPFAGRPDAKWVFESVAAAGFDWARIPTHWDCHVAKTAPFAVDPAFMAQLNTTVGWALTHGLRVMVNTHHENSWVEGAWNSTANSTKAKIAVALPRLVAIWDQIATHFSSFPDDRLVFELFNEPKAMTVVELNTMNNALLPVIRRTNPTRQVHLGGLAQMGVGWIISHPDAMDFRADDKNLALTVHSYDPWKFAGSSGPPPSHAPPEHTFDPAGAYKVMGELKAWSDKHNIPVYHDEFGCVTMQTNRTARLEYYVAYSKAAEQNGVGWAIWDDDGWWKTLNRTGDRTWDADVLKALGMPTGHAGREQQGQEQENDGDASVNIRKSA